jgi:hypothetical protein
MGVINAPHCGVCARAYATLEEAEACTHDGNAPNVANVMEKLLEQVHADNGQRLKVARDRYEDQLRLNTGGRGLAQQREAQQAAGRGGKRSDDKEAGVFDFRVWGGKRRF